MQTRSFPAAEYGDRSGRDRAIADWLDERGVELVVLAGYMQLLSDEFLARFPGRVINVHPALLPAFPGLQAVQQAIDYGVKVFGVTVHFVDDGVDTGPVILQRAIELPDASDADEVLAALHPIEHELLPEAVALIAAGARRLSTRSVPRRVRIRSIESGGDDAERAAVSALRDDGPCRGAGRPGAAVGLGQDRDRRVRPRPGRPRDRDHLHRRHRPASSRRPASRSGRSPTSPVFRRSWTAGSRRFTPSSTPGSCCAARQPGHMAAAQEQDVEFVDLVCVNLYPFERTANARGVPDDEVIENIDIGGPTMIRAAAKNSDFAAPVVSPESYDAVLAELRESDRRLSPTTREFLAAEAFAYTARYDTAIARWFQEKREDFPPLMVRAFEQRARAALRREPASARRLLRAGRGADARAVDGRPARRQAALLSTTCSTSIRRGCCWASSRSPRA